MASMVPFNKKRMNPIYKAGGVNINGKVSAYDMEARFERMKKGAALGVGEHAPYFDAPVGRYSRSFNVMEEGEIAFRNRDYTLNEMSRNTVISPSFDSNVAVDVSTTLNLLGDRGRVVKDASGRNVSISDAELREEIALKLQVMGIIIADNRINNESNVTIMSSGIVTVENNGTKLINVGSWVIAEVPSYRDVPKNVEGKGGKDYPEEQDGGRVTLRFAPYDKCIHLVTPDRVFACISALRNNESEAREKYLHSYIALTNTLQDSILNLILSGIRTLIEKDYLAGTKTLETVRGTTEPKGMPEAAKTKSLTKQRVRLLMAENREIREKIIDDVFKAYISNKREEIKRDRECITAANGIGLFLMCCAEHVRIVLERVLGRAISTAAPFSDFDISLSQLV